MAVTAAVGLVCVGTLAYSRPAIRSVLPARRCASPVLCTPRIDTAAIQPLDLSPPLPPLEVHLPAVPLICPIPEEPSPPPPERRSRAPALLAASMIVLGLGLRGNSYKRAFEAYSSAALAWPIVTKSATSAIAYFLGDQLAQRVAAARCGGVERLDTGRTLRATAAGAIVHGPQLHWWTAALDRFFGPGSLLLKIALDQTFFAVWMNAGFTALTEALRPASPAQIWARVRASSWPSLRASWKFWPAVHLATYSIVPMHLRVLYIDVVEVIWVAILSATVAKVTSDDGAE